MLNNTTRCLKLIFLCQCVRLQAILNTSEPTLSHSNVAGNFLRGHFLPYSKTHGFFVGCENVHDLRSQFARTFHLTVCLGQETVSFFEKNDQLQQPLYNNQPCFFTSCLVITCYTCSSLALSVESSFPKSWASASAPFSVGEKSVER